MARSAVEIVQIRSKRFCPLLCPRQHAQSLRVAANEPLLCQEGSVVSLFVLFDNSVGQMEDRRGATHMSRSALTLLSCSALTFSCFAHNLRSSASWSAFICSISAMSAYQVRKETFRSSAVNIGSERRWVRIGRDLEKLRVSKSGLSLWLNDRPDLGGIPPLDDSM
jgi:hypothetical protein